jgi:hypothetical protein
MSSSKKFTCKRTLRQVFIRDYRLEIQSVMFGKFDPAPLTFSLVQLSPHPSCVNKYTVCTYTVCKGVWASGPKTYNYLPQSPFTGKFFRWWHFALPSMSLNFSTSSFGTLIWQTFQLYVQDELYEAGLGTGKISLNDEWFLKAIK